MSKIMNYLSNLDLPRGNPNKPQYNFSNDWERVEINLSPIIRDESLSSDSEIYSFIYFLFLKRPQLAAEVIETSAASDFPTKLLISDRKSIEETSTFIVERFLDTKYEYETVIKENGLLYFEIRFFFTHRNHLISFPFVLLEEFGFEMPAIIFKFYPSKKSIADKLYLYPIWVFAKESQLIKQEIQK